MEKLHVIGNGPSHIAFDESDGIRVGCNFAHADRGLTWTMIADIKPVKKLYEGVALPCPAVLSERASAFVAGKTLKLDERRLTIHKVVPFLRRKAIHDRWGMNSAQHAVWYGIEEFQPDEVHLWGCDSLWSTNIESTTDQIVHKDLTFMNSQHIYLVWRQYWNYIFNYHPNIKFYVHGPEKPDLEEAENYTWRKI
jgi:hypothetical protein